MAWRLIDGVVVTGASNSIRATNAVNHAVQVGFSNAGGSATAITVDLEGSLDGVTFFQLATHDFTGGELTAKAAMFHVVDKLIAYARLNVTTLTDTGVTTINAWYDNDHDHARKG